MNFATYIINLPRDRERRVHISKLMDERGIPFELVEAVDGTALTVLEREGWILPSGAPRPLVPGEIGCFLSHRRVWKRLVEEGLDYGVVFEDDIRLSSRASALLSDLGWIPSEADIVRLETALMKVTWDQRSAAAVDGRAVRRLRSFHWGTAGYVISRRAAEDLLSLSEFISLPVDDFMFNPERSTSRKLKIYQLDPAICVQDNVLDPETAFRSHIGGRNELIQSLREPRPKGFGLVSREVKRARRKFLLRVRDFISRRRRGIVQFT